LTQINAVTVISLLKVRDCWPIAGAVRVVREGNHMNSKKTHIVLTAAALFASTQLAAAQGTSGGTGAIASIPSSVVRGHEQGRGLVSIIAGSTLPQPDVSKQAMTRRRESPTPK
jgi:hypothetical protein